MDASGASDPEPDSAKESDGEEETIDPALAKQLKRDAYARMKRRDRAERAEQGLPEREFRPMPESVLREFRSSDRPATDRYVP